MFAVGLIFTVFKRYTIYIYIRSGKILTDVGAITHLPLYTLVHISYRDTLLLVRYTQCNFIYLMFLPKRHAVAATWVRYFLKFYF